jgi:hypothetical protein
VRRQLMQVIQLTIRSSMFCRQGMCDGERRTTTMTVDNYVVFSSMYPFSWPQMVINTYVYE